MAQAYQPDEERSLSRTFFVLSLILVVVSLYTVIDETFVRRPWKRYQTTFYELEYDKLRADLQAKEEALLPTRGDLEAKLQQAQAALDENAPYRKARDELEREKNRLADLSQEQQFAKSRLDAEYYQYKKAEHEGDLSDAARYKARVEQLEQQIANLEVPIAEHKARVDALHAEVKAAEAPLDEITEERRLRLSDPTGGHHRVEHHELQRAAHARGPLPNLPHGHRPRWFRGSGTALCHASASQCPVAATPGRKFRLHGLPCGTGCGPRRALGSW
jgi:hypothetical protein